MGVKKVMLIVTLLLLAWLIGWTSQESERLVWVYIALVGLVLAVYSFFRVFGLEEFGIEYAMLSVSGLLAVTGMGIFILLPVASLLLQVAQVTAAATVMMIFAVIAIHR